MYFASRVQAGRMIAAQLMPKYRYEDCAVVALNDGGVVVGAQIAMQLHCAIHMILYEEIKLPMEPQAISAITQTGAYVYNTEYTAAEVEELAGEYRGFIEQEKMTKLAEMDRLIRRGDVIRPDLLKGRVVILVSDALRSPFSLDLALAYLKPINYEKLVVATPMASVRAVDRMHILADDICCLNVLETTLETNHYYDKQDVPDHQKIIEIIENIVLKWK
jgi:putative phosphoribosyl transferase